MPLTVVFLDRETLPVEIVLRSPRFPHRWIDFARTHPQQVVERAVDAGVIVVNKVPLRADALGQLKHLKLVAVAATGTDNVDVAWCAANGVVVRNVTGYAAHSVPEHAFALILALRRGLIAYVDDIRRGRWQESPQFTFFAAPIRDLAGSRLGIVGAGSIGRSVAALGAAFGMEPVFTSPRGAPEGYPAVALDELLATSDVITLHCPLTPSTRGLIGTPQFQAMRRQPLLINTARGGIVDEAALVRAMDEGLVSGAGFDVAATEPPRPDNPLLSLVGRPNFILTPHVAWASHDAMQTLADQLIDNIERFVAGNDV